MLMAAIAKRKLASTVRAHFLASFLQTRPRDDENTSCTFTSNLMEFEIDIRYHTRYGIAWNLEK